MYAFVPLFVLASIQATYGPVEPAPAKPAAAPELALSDTERMLRAQGVSDAGIRALRAVPLPAIAPGATRAAQCTVEKLTESDPLSLPELASAMEERDATAAAQAKAQTRYVLAALSVLGGDDRRVFLKVVGTGQLAIGGPLPPRPEAPRDARARSDRGPPPGGRGPGGGQGGPGGPGGPGGGGRGLSGRGDRPDAPPSFAGGPPPPGGSACDRLLAG
ncbi:hypothetical protein [Sphingomonas sp.]|uniref:hypothetical protein n=1 Tax=Sphingomonas sp. TaxID=28214 RepID=UPI001ED24996|nr:hypothetical protein [Sphingomonas sp.]MBX3595475.1 hypothetical protein [Sphingomonas sp.]